MKSDLVSMLDAMKYANLSYLFDLSFLYYESYITDYIYY